MKKKTVSRCGARLNFDKEKFIRELNGKKEAKKKPQIKGRRKSVDADPDKINNDVGDIMNFKRTEVNHE